MRGIAKGLAWTVGGLALAAVAGYTALVVINWRDEAPSADVQRFAALERGRPAVADADNAWVYVLGFDAPEGEDPVALGIRRRASVEHPAPRRNASPQWPGTDAAPRANLPPAVAALIGACHDGGSACDARLRAEPAALGAWLQARSVPQARYAQLLARHQWRETIPRDVVVSPPDWPPVLRAQELYLLRTWQLAGEGEADAVRTRLDADLAFWRSVLASSDLLITKAIATRAVERHFALGNLALKHLPTPADAAVPASWRRPLSVPERSLARTLAGEWRVTDAVVRTGRSAAFEPPRRSTVEAAVDRIARPMFQPQATSNARAARMAALGAASELPPARLRAGLDALYRDWDAQAQAFHAYNPVGNLLASVGGERGLRGYVVRAGDLEGARRAALLAHEMRVAAAAGGDPASALDRTALRDPYTGARLGWDAAQREVVFTGLARGPRGRWRMPL